MTSRILLTSCGLMSRAELVGSFSDGSWDRWAVSGGRRHSDCSVWAPIWPGKALLSGSGVHCWPVRGSAPLCDIFAAVLARCDAPPSWLVLGWTQVTSAWLNLAAC